MEREGKGQDRDMKWEGEGAEWEKWGVGKDRGRGSGKERAGMEGEREGGINQVRRVDNIYELKLMSKSLMIIDAGMQSEEAWHYCIAL